MVDFGASDIGSLKDEVAETRKQFGKAEQQLRHVLAAFASIDTRFVRMERRARWTQIGTHLVGAALVAGATYVLGWAETRALRQELDHTRASLKQERGQGAQRLAAVTAELQSLKVDEAARQSARDKAVKFLEYIEADRQDQAVALLARLDLDHLDPLARVWIEERSDRLRLQVAEDGVRSAREFLSRSQRSEAIEALNKAIRVDPRGPYAHEARFLLATTLREAKRYHDAAVLYAEMTETEQDEGLLEDARYWEGYCRARAGETEAATRILQDLVNGGGRHAMLAQHQLATLEPSAQPGGVTAGVGSDSGEGTGTGSRPGAAMVVQVR